MISNNHKKDLEQRIKDFARKIVRCFSDLDRSREELRILGRQMIRSGTSAGVNYREASRTQSDAELSAKIELCTQEAHVTQYWRELLSKERGIASSVTKPLWTEAYKLIRFFVTMSRNTESKK